MRHAHPESNAEHVRPSAVRRSVVSTQVFTTHRLARRALGLAGRLPWLAFLWFRVGFAIRALSVTRNGTSTGVPSQLSIATSKTTAGLPRPTHRNLFDPQRSNATAEQACRLRNRFPGGCFARLRFAASQGELTRRPGLPCVNPIIYGETLLAQRQTAARCNATNQLAGWRPLDGPLGKW